MTPEREAEIHKWFNTWKSAADTPTHFQVDGMMGDVLAELDLVRAERDMHEADSIVWRSLAHEAVGTPPFASKHELNCEFDKRRPGR